MYTSRQYKNKAGNKVSRQVESGRWQLMSMKDNRGKGVKMQATDRQKYAIQMQTYNTLPKRVANDMIYYLKVCFKGNTIENYNAFKIWKDKHYRSDVSIGDIINRIRPKEHLNPIAVDYKQIENKALPQKEALTTWLSDGKQEHMWANNGNQINVTSRNNEKKPHPTLFGGDPTIVGAGLMNLEENEYKTITIDNSSGHFRPEQVDTNTIDKVKDASSDDCRVFANGTVVKKTVIEKRLELIKKIRKEYGLSREEQLFDIVRLSLKPSLPPASVDPTLSSYVFSGNVKP